MFTKMLKRCLSCLKGKMFLTFLGYKAMIACMNLGDTWRSSKEHVPVRIWWCSFWFEIKVDLKKQWPLGRWCYGYIEVHMGSANCANKTHFWFLLSLFHWGLLNILGISRKVCRNLREIPKEKKNSNKFKNKNINTNIAMKHKRESEQRLNTYFATNAKKIVNIQCM